MSTRSIWRLTPLVLSVAVLSSGCGGSGTKAINSPNGLGENGFSLETVANVDFDASGGGPAAIVSDGKGTFHISNQPTIDLTKGQILTYSKSSGVKTVLTFAGQPTNPPSNLFADNAGGVHGLAAISQYPTTLYAIQHYDSSGAVITESSTEVGTNTGTFNITATDGAGNYFGTANPGNSQPGKLVELNAALGRSELGEVPLSIGGYPKVLAADASGNVYGCTVDSDPSNNASFFVYSKAAGVKSLATFSGVSWSASAVFDGLGNLYIARIKGQFFGDGELYRYSTADGLTKVATFTSGQGAASTALAITSDGKGNVYGSWNQQGKFGNGYMFKYSPASGLTTIADFNSAIPFTTLLAADTNGSVFGAVDSSSGGKGRIFEVSAR